MRPLPILISFHALLVASPVLAACPPAPPFVQGCPLNAGDLNNVAPLASPAFTGQVTVLGPLIVPVDPGIRLGSTDAGGSLPGLSGPEQTFFSTAQSVFEEVDSVSGTIGGEPGVGLGPIFNSNGCSSCHAQPAVGGTSPATNPEVAIATLHGASNTIPSFVTSNGPVVEVRFKSDNRVHQLYTIVGRSDAPGSCPLSQPTFTPGTYALRIPTPLFGLGLVENTPDQTLRANQNAGRAGPLGIVTGDFNYGIDGTIARFGWKAQDKSLLTFAGEAYNIEIGVSNEVLPTEPNGSVCEPNNQPEDATPPPGGLADTSNFASFMRLLAPPTAEPGGYTTASATVTAGSISNGAAQFVSAGCDVCHISSQATTNSIYTGQSNVTYHPYSDFALHNMGQLGDGITQNNATGNQFRTAPLWGAGQRIFFLHDGRTTDLLQAIMAHQSAGSEANTVISQFQALGSSVQQDILNFLRSL